MSDPGEVTVLLQSLRAGRREVESQLLNLVYAELRKLARGYLHRERADHTLQPTELVHEVYLRMAGGDTDWQNRAHFFAVAAQAMRRILVDHARAHQAQKRGDGISPLPFVDELFRRPGNSDDLVDVDEALARLALFDPRQARIVELRFFGGLSIEETAEALGCGARTVNREWRLAQAWLRRELSPPERS